MYASVSISFSFQCFFFYYCLALLLFQCSLVWIVILSLRPSSARIVLLAYSNRSAGWQQIKMWTNISATLRPNDPIDMDSVWNGKVHGHPIKCITDFHILIFVTIVRFVAVHHFLWISWVDISSRFFLLVSILSFFSHWMTAQCIQSEWSQTKQSSVKLIFFLLFVCRRKVWAITSHFFRSVVVSNHKIIWNATKRELRAFLKLQMSTSFVKTPIGE